MYPTFLLKVLSEIIYGKPVPSERVAVNSLVRRMVSVAPGRANELAMGCDKSAPTDGVGLFVVGGGDDKLVPGLGPVYRSCCLSMFLQVEGVELAVV